MLKVNQSLSSIVGCMVLGAAMLLSSGCSKSSGGGSAAPVAPPTQPTPPIKNPHTIPAGPGPELIAIELVDIDTSKTVTLGDELVFTFDDNVTIRPTATPDQAFQLLVTSDTFGAGARLSLNSSNKSQVVLTLGTDAKIRISGTFDAKLTKTYSPSGIIVRNNAPIIGAIAARPVMSVAALDIDGPFTGGCEMGAQMTIPRGLHTSTLLDDGRILIVGGLGDSTVSTASNLVTIYDDVDKYLTSSEIFDPEANRFYPVEQFSSSKGYMRTDSGFQMGRIHHTATKLKDGRVLITGGETIRWWWFGWLPWFTPETLESDEIHIFDPKSNSFSKGANKMAIGRAKQSATLLDDGRVLIAGGYNRHGKERKLWIFNLPQIVWEEAALYSAEVFDPATNRVSPLGGSKLRKNMMARMGHSAVLLPSGEVLITGGATMPDPGNVVDVNKSEKFNGTPVFSPLARLQEARRFHTTSALPNGQVLVAGGWKAASLNTLEMYDPIIDKYRTAGRLNVPRARHAAALYKGDDLMVFIGGVSGYSGNSAIEADKVESYNVNTGDIEIVCDMKISRNSHTATRLPDGRIIIIGGFVDGISITSKEGSPTGTAEIFSIE